MLVLIPVTGLAAETPVTENAASAIANPADARAPANGDYALEVPKNLRKDGVPVASDDEGLLPAAQGLDFILNNNDFRKLGGYDEVLKTVSNVDYYGTRHVGSERYPLEVHNTRPDWTRTLIKIGASSTVEISKSNGGMTIDGAPPGLAIEDERALLETFDFDTPAIAWEEKRQVFKPLGVQKLPGMLTWKILADRPGGYHRVLYLDTHTGDIVKFTIINARGARVLDVVPHDYRLIEGIRVPFAIDYRDAGGTLLAGDRFDRVEVKRKRS